MQSIRLKHAATQVVTTSRYLLSDSQYRRFLHVLEMWRSGVLTSHVAEYMLTHIVSESNATLQSSVRQYFEYASQLHRTYTALETTLE